jgi:hypothetical protein
VNRGLASAAVLAVAGCVLYGIHAAAQDDDPIQKHAEILSEARDACNRQDVSFFKWEGKWEEPCKAIMAEFDKDGWWRKVYIPHVAADDWEAVMAYHDMFPPGGKLNLPMPK